MKQLLFLSLFLPSMLVSQTPLVRDLDALMRQSTDAQSAGSALLVSVNGRTIYQNGYGLANMDTKTPITKHTTFRMASVSKQFTAMAILMLEKQGKISFDDPIRKYFPNFASVGNHIQIRHLLTHTSGLLDYEYLAGDEFTLENQLLDADVLRLVQSKDSTYFPIGTQFRYSNGAFCLLTLIVEQVSGKPFAQFLHDHIFKPLRMNHSTMFEKGKPIANRSFGYRRKEGGFVFSDQSSMSATKGDGAVYTSLADYLKWHNALQRNRFVDLAAALQRLKAPTNTQNTFYGAGWFFATGEQGIEMFHSGSTSGFSNIVIRIPATNTVIAFFSNTANNHEAFKPIYLRLKQEHLLSIPIFDWHEETN